MPFPYNQPLLTKMLDIVDPASPDGKKAKEILEDQLVKGKNVGLAHFVLGTMAFAEGNDKNGIFHLEEAQKTGRMGPEVANNLAWILMKQTGEVSPATRCLGHFMGGMVIPAFTSEHDKKTLARSLELANTAIKDLPCHIGIL